MAALVLSWGAAHAKDNVKFIEGVSNAEDIVVLKGSDWVIGSGLRTPGKNNSGHLYLINARTGQAEAVYPREGANVSQDVLAANCPAAPDPEAFDARGLGLRDSLNGKFELYVVNHPGPTKGRHAVELFSVDASGGKPKITWTDCVVMPAGTYPNDVVALPDGGFAVTNTGDRTVGLLKPNSGVA
jgi:hypothetical protein